MPALVVLLRAELDALPVRECTGGLPYASQATGAEGGSADGDDAACLARNAHGSRSEALVDPVLLAATVVLRLQTIVARELASADRAVVTVRPG